MVSVQIMATKKQNTKSDQTDFEASIDEPPKSETHDIRSMPEPKKEDRNPVFEIKGEQVTGKNETRLFQTGPFEKTWLTKAEATDKKLYWADA